MRNAESVQVQVFVGLWVSVRVMLVITLNAAEIKCHVHQSTGSTPWTNLVMICRDLVMIWSWFGHDLVMIWSWTTTSNHRGSAFTASFDGCSSTNISCLNRRNNRDPLTDFTWFFLTENFGSLLRILLCSSHVDREQHKSFSSRMVSALITWGKRRLKLQVSNTHFAAKIETTTTCPCDTEAVRIKQVGSGHGMQQETWFLWSQQKTDLTSQELILPEPTCNWIVDSIPSSTSQHTFWPPESQLKEWSCVAGILGGTLPIVTKKHVFKCVCIYIYSLCTVYNIYISEIPIKGWLLSFVLLSWHARLILYSTVGITDNDTQEKWINVSQTMAGTE